MMSSLCYSPSDNKPKRLFKQLPSNFSSTIPSDHPHALYKCDCDTRMRRVVLGPRDTRYAEMLDPFVGKLGKLHGWFRRQGTIASPSKIKPLQVQIPQV